MFWEGKGWVSLGDADAQAAVRLIDAALRKTGVDVSWASSSVEEPGPSSLLVESVRARALPFYRAHWLYELGLSLGRQQLSERFEAAHCFVVVAGQPAEGDGKALPPHARPGSAGQAVLLDFTNGPLYRLNEEASLDLQLGTDAGQALAVEYVDFFTSFLAGGTGEPFLIVRSGTFHAPDGISRSAMLPAFETRIAERVIHEPYVRPRRYRFFPEDATLPDAPDDPRVAPMSGTPPVQSPTPGAEPPKGTDEAGAPPSSKVELDGAARIPDMALKSYSAADASFDVAATMLYGDTFAAVTIRVKGSPSKPSAVDVEMVSDDPIGEDAALSRFRVDRLSALTVALLRKKDRIEVTAEQFLASVRRSSRRGRRPVENVRVLGDVDFRGLPPSYGIRARDVEFLGRVSLEECRRRAGVEFERCKFARSLDARNVSIQGDLTLTECTVLGALGKHDELTPAICLDGGSITGSLGARLLTVDGLVSCERLSVRGVVNLRGIDVRMREARHAEPVGLSLRNARLDAGLDLSPEIQQAPLSRRLRSRIEATVDLHSLSSSEVILCGLICGALSFDYAKLSGKLDMSLVPSDNDSAPLVGRHFRVRVLQQVSGRGAKLLEWYLAGAQVGAFLDLVELSVVGSIFAVVVAGYRTVVGGEVVLSGADIGSDCDFSGAFVGAAFEVRTGSIGRMFLGQCPTFVQTEDRTEGDYFSGEVGSLELISVTGLRSLAFAGIQVRGMANSPVPLLLEHISVSGDVRFWWARREAVAVVEFETAARAAGGAELVWRRKPLPGTCSAAIEGNLEMRKLVTAGHVDLTNVKLGAAGQVRLNDARIGTDLYARSSAYRGEDFERVSASSNDSAPPRLEMASAAFHLDNARIEGDAILSGLTLLPSAGASGEFRGRGLVVGGQLELVAGPKLFAKISGLCDLAGAQAAVLSLHGETFDPATKVRMERCRVGRLSIREPIPRLDLTGVEVTDWDLAGRDGTDAGAEAYIAILKRMEPMDRTVWIRVETERRNQTQTEDADRIYRAMKDHEPPTRLRLVLFPIWLFWRHFLGYGTRVIPALASATVLAFALYLVLLAPTNVQASDGLLAQLYSQCRMFDGPRGARQGDRRTTEPEKCQVYRQAIVTSSSPDVDIAASELESDYGRGNALQLTLRYAVPLVVFFGDPNWVPAEGKDAQVLPGSSLGFRSTCSPASLAAIVLVFNTLLLGYVVAFAARRFMR